ncbi:uncharacterized protein LOC120016182 [Tripterygium wilfordii]|uniref:uncharacterized protein LOC120016182 n=1 Tax=Tripterygium wilfordii TaxID=458696 RepID=UPI0018F853AA|nr:uncharacterized protein LOC120016182 [Tripterygium wilfordii]
MENPHETQFSDLNLRLSLGGIYGGNLKEKSFTRSFTELMSHNSHTTELGNFLSLERFGSMPSEGEGQKRMTIDLNGLHIEGQSKRDEETELGNFLSFERFGSMPSEGEGQKRRTIELNGLHIEGQSKRGNVEEKKCIKANTAPRLPSSRFKITWLAIASAENNPAFNRALARIKDGEACTFQRRHRIRAQRKINTSIGEANKEINNLFPDAIDSICDKKSKETQLSQQEEPECSDLNLGLSFRSICDENFKGKPVARSSSVTGILTQSKDNSELGTLLSVDGSWSMPTQGEQEQRRSRNSSESQIDSQNRLGKEVSGGDNVGKEKASLATNDLPPASSSKIPTWAATFVERKPSLHRSLARIKEKDGCSSHKRLRLATAMVLPEAASEKDGNGRCTDRLPNLDLCYYPPLACDRICINTHPNKNCHGRCSADMMCICTYDCP